MNVSIKINIFPHLFCSTQFMVLLSFFSQTTFKSKRLYGVVAMVEVLTAFIMLFFHFRGCFLSSVKIPQQFHVWVLTFGIKKDDYRCCSPRKLSFQSLPLVEGKKE